MCVYVRVLHVACGQRLVSVVGQLLMDKHITVAQLFALDHKRNH